MDWYKRYMGDYGKDTADLTMTQDGAYTRLLDRYYSSGEPLPADKQKLYRITRAFERWEREAVDSVLAKFFTLTDAGYTQKRTEKELAKYKKAADVHTANLGRKMDSQHGPEKLEARNQIKDKTLKDSARSQEAFQIFYSQYPNPVKKPVALRAWLKIPESEWPAVMAGLASWIKCPQWQDRSFIPYPATFLNGKQWQDEAPKGGQNGTGSSKNEQRTRNTLEAARRAMARGSDSPIDSLLPALSHRA